MPLSLNHAQRLNLVSVLGSLDMKGREAHAVWHLQDRLDLNSEEKRTIGFREETINGFPVQLWDQKATLPVRHFEFEDADMERIRKAVEDFPNFKSARDRFWLEPLLAQLSPSPNGAAKS